MSAANQPDQWTLIGRELLAARTAARFEKRLFGTIQPATAQRLLTAMTAARAALTIDDARTKARAAA